MPPLILPVHERNPQPRNVRAAADILDGGGIVLVPTETGYCFVGDARLEATHRALLSLREAHPRHKPFSLLCKDIAQASASALLTTAIYRIATRAFPGPYTFILEISRSTPKFAGSSKRKAVGIRISSHPVTQALIHCFGHPLLITSVTDAEEIQESAYYDGEGDAEEVPWWTQAEAICERFKGGIGAALALADPLPLHVSTVIDFSKQPVELVRDGGWGLDIIGMI